MVDQEYAFEYGHHPDSLILANMLADTQTAYESMRSVLDDLPAENQATNESYESERAFDAPEYEVALDRVYREHVCRTEVYPQPVLSTFKRVNLDVYGSCGGQNEYVLLETVRLRDWDLRDHLDEIDVPMLVLSGEYDEIEPAIAQDIDDRHLNSPIHVFDDGSHMLFWERPDEHYDVVESLLREGRT